MSEPTFTVEEVNAMVDESFTRGFNAGYTKGWNQILDPNVREAYEEFIQTIKGEVALEKLEEGEQ